MSATSQAREALRLSESGAPEWRVRSELRKLVDFLSTVTDAEVEAAGRVLGMGDGMEHWIDRDSVVAALEAAREARS